MRRQMGLAVGVLLLLADAVQAEIPKGVEIVVEADRKEYFLGEPVLLKFGIRNTSDKPVTVNAGGDYRGGTGAGRFLVTATDAKGVKAIDPDPEQVMMGGIGGDREIAPGATEWMPVSPGRYCLIDKAGTYTIRVSHDLGFFAELDREEATPADAAKYPAGEIKIAFKMPNAAEAEKIVDGLVAMKADNFSMIDSKRPQGEVRRDFGTLRLPVYLPALEKYAKAGEADAVAGIGSIETPEATKALIGLLKSSKAEVVQQVTWPLNLRLPMEPNVRVDPFDFRSQDKTGRYAGIVKAAWRPEFAADLRAFAVGELTRPSGAMGNSYWDTLGFAAHYLEVIGEKEDAPAVYAALETAMKQNVREHGLPPKNVGSLVQTAAALMARGAAAPDRSMAISPLVEMERIRQDKGYRPARWQGTLTEALGNEQAYFRQVSLQVLYEIPEAIPAEAVVKLGALLKDPDAQARMAAINAAAKTTDVELGKAILDMLRTSNDAELLSATGYAATRMHLNQPFLEICAERLSEHWEIFARPLFECLDVEDGGMRASPSPEDAAAAQKLWMEFVAKHKEELAAGKKIPLEQADVRMVPAP